MVCTGEWVQLWDSEATAAGTSRVLPTRLWSRESVTQLTQASQDSSFYKKERSCHDVSSKTIASFGFRANKFSLNDSHAC